MNWEADQQLVRGSAQHNLAIGEPEFLRRVFEPHYPRHYGSDLSYPDTKPSDDLLFELRKLHPKGHIVVTNGAKQALHAAVHALKINNPGLVTGLYHHAPYWPSYPTIAKYANLPFHTQSSDQFDVDVVTSPNNPDGKERKDGIVWDAVYAHSVYGWSGAEPMHAISVWSAGKMLGSPGTRVGWLVTENGALAGHAQQFVEQTTSGVSTVGQHHVAATLRNTERVRKDLYTSAEFVLKTNRSRFNLYLDKYITDLGTGKGMFMWFQAKDPEKFANALSASGVIMVTGKACGDERPGVYRASLGLDLMPHQNAVIALSKELK